MDDEHQHIEISISDTGSGIPDKIINHIFDNSFTTKDYGSGLGLYTTKQTITCHNGTIKSGVKSTVCGLHFIIIIPCIKAK